MDWEIDYIGYILHSIILSFWIWEIDYTGYTLHSIILSFWIWEIDYIGYILHSIIFGFVRLITLDYFALYYPVFFFLRLLFELLFVCVLWLVCVSLHDNWKFGTLIRGLCIWNLDIRFNDSSPNSLLVDKPTKKDRKVRV